MQSKQKVKLACFYIWKCLRGVEKVSCWHYLDNVDLENSTIHICHNRTGSKKEILEHLTTPKTKNGIRTMSLPPKVIDMLKAEKAQQTENKQILGSSYKYMTMIML